MAVLEGCYRSPKKAVYGSPGVPGSSGAQGCLLVGALGALGIPQDLFGAPEGVSLRVPRAPEDFLGAPRESLEPLRISPWGHLEP